MNPRIAPVAALLVLLAGCIAPRYLQWPESLPPIYHPADLGDAPTSEVVPVLAGDVAPASGMIVPADYFVWLEAVAFEAAPEVVRELRRCQEGRTDDRGFASEEYTRAVGHLRGQLGPICALCGGLGATAGAAGAGGACSALP